MTFPSRSVTTLMPLQNLSAFSTPSVFYIIVPSVTNTEVSIACFAKSISFSTSWLRKGYWVLRLSAWLVNFTRYSFSLLSTLRQHLLPPFLEENFDGNRTLIKNLRLWDWKWKLLSMQKKICCKQMRMMGCMVKAIHLAMNFQGKNDNCVREVCLASIKRETPGICGRVVWRYLYWLNFQSI